MIFKTLDRVAKASTKICQFADAPFEIQNVKPYIMRL